MSEQTFGALALMLALLLIAGAFTLLLRLIRTGRLERNHWIGLRIPSTLSSDRAWEAGHRAAVPALRCTVAVAVVFAAAAAVVLGWSATASAVTAGIGLTGALACTFVSAWRGRRAARAA